MHGASYESGKNGRSVLVVDDDVDIRRLVRHLLEKVGCDVSEAASGKEGLAVFHASSPDLVVLDISMPGLDGWATLERIRDVSSVPVVMLTARTSELEVVRGLKGGADDYVKKPFGRQELLARVERLLQGLPTEERARRLADGSLAVDLVERAVRVNGRSVSLTPLEFRLLAALLAHAGEALGHERLLELVWGDARGRSRDNVKLYVGYLRRKLADGGADASRIETVPGFGYRYRPTPADDAGPCEVVR